HALRDARRRVDPADSIEVDVTPVVNVSDHHANLVRVRHQGEAQRRVTGRPPRLLQADPVSEPVPFYPLACPAEGCRSDLLNGLLEPGQTRRICQRFEQLNVHVVWRIPSDGMRTLAGTDAMRRVVYSCDGRSSTSVISPSSTIRPR